MKRKQLNFSVIKMYCLFCVLNVSATHPTRVLIQFTIRGFDNISSVTLLQMSRCVCHVITFRTNLSQINATEFQINLTFDCRLSAVDDPQAAIYHHPIPTELKLPSTTTPIPTELKLPSTTTPSPLNSSCHLPPPHPH